MKVARAIPTILLTVVLSALSSEAAKKPTLTFHFTTYDAPGAIQTWLTGVNNSGEIIGWYLDKSLNSHGFTLTNGKFKLLDDPNGNMNELFGINSSSDVVGMYSDPCIEELCTEGFVDRAGAFTNIGAPWFTHPPEDDAPQSAAYGINDFGAIVGLAGDGFGGEVGFVVKDHKYRKIVVPKANGEYAAGINNAGLITVNWVTNSSEGASIYDGKTFKDISIPHHSVSTAGGINNAGDVVLYYGSFFGGPIRGALLHAKHYYKFFYPEGKNLTIPFGINDKRTIVGVWAKGAHASRFHGLIVTY